MLFGFVIGGLTHPEYYMVWQPAICIVVIGDLVFAVARKKMKIWRAVVVLLLDALIVITPQLLYSHR